MLTVDFSHLKQTFMSFGANTMCNLIYFTGPFHRKREEASVFQNNTNNKSQIYMNNKITYSKQK